MANILLVDDDDDFIKLQREVLRLAGHSVVIASNGKEAMRAAKDNPFDLVTTDLVMPAKEGIETIVELCRKFPASKIIAMSGGGRVDAKDYLVIARQLGAQRTFAKPIRADVLLQTVTEELAGPAPLAVPLPNGTAAPEAAERLS